MPHRSPLPVCALALALFVDGGRTSALADYGTSARELGAGQAPIVTGGAISLKHRQKWARDRALYRQCKACFETQPYPDDDLLDQLLPGALLTGSVVPKVKNEVQVPAN